MKRMGEMSQELKQLKETMDQSYTQTQDHLKILKEADDDQRTDNGFKWSEFESEIKGLRSDLQVDTTRLQTLIEDRYNTIIKEIDTKWSEMEKRDNRNKSQVEENHIHNQRKDAERMEALEQKVDRLSHLIAHLGESMKQMEEKLTHKFKEIDDKQHLNTETTWNKCRRSINAIITEVRLETARLQTEMITKNTEIVQEMNDKCCKMEETARHHAAEIEQVKDQRHQTYKQTERKFRQVDNKQHNDAEWMRQALDSQRQLLQQTTKLHMQTEELCKQKINEIEEKSIHLKQQQDEMECMLSKTVDQVGELSMKIQRLTESVGQTSNRNGDSFKYRRAPINEFGEGTSHHRNINEGSTYNIREAKSMPEFLNQQPKTKSQMTAKLRIKEISEWEEVFSYKLTYNKFIKRPARYKVPEYNLLLMAESAAEITKFINCFEVLTKYTKLDDALNCYYPLKPLISTPFEINGKEITLTSDEEIAELENTSCKCYEYLFKRYLVRLIDTAGYGTNTFDDQMAERDVGIIRDTRHFIEKLQSLHCIVIVMKSTEIELSPGFLNSLQRYLANFNKSRVSNLLFVITDIEFTDYKVDKLKQAVENILKHIAPTSVVRTCHNINFFLIYNEGLRCMVAHSLGAQLSESEMKSGRSGWHMASEQCQSLVTRVQRLQPWREEFFSSIFRKKQVHKSSSTEQLK